MATLMFFEGRQLRACPISGRTAKRIAFAHEWVEGKPKRRVEVYLIGEHYTIRGTATGKGN